MTEGGRGEKAVRRKEGGEGRERRRTVDSGAEGVMMIEGKVEDGSCIKNQLNCKVDKLDFLQILVGETLSF